MLASVDCVKLLGVQLDGKLNFDHHISVLCVRASLGTRALSRIGRFISEDCRMKLYDTFILPNFLYCSIAWHIGSKSNGWMLQKSTKEPLQVVLNDYVSSYPELFRYECVKIWNESPTNINGAYDLNDSKGTIRKWSGPSCRCQNCILYSMLLV